MDVWWVGEDPREFGAFRSALTATGVTVRTFESAAAVTATLGDEVAVDPELVISDLMLSAWEHLRSELASLVDHPLLMDGWAFARLLNAHPQASAWPVLLLTRARSVGRAHLSQPEKNIVGVWRKSDFNSPAEFAERVRVAKRSGSWDVGAVGQSDELAADFRHSANARLHAADRHLSAARRSGRRRSHHLDAASSAIARVRHSLDRWFLIDSLARGRPTSRAKGTAADALPVLVRSALKPVADASVGVSIADLPAGSPTRLALSPAELLMVTTELLINAVTYSTGDRSARVDVRWTDVGAVLHFLNDGVTLRKDELTMVGTRGWRGDVARRSGAGGTGHGLWLAGRVLTDQGGSLRLSGGRGRATVVEVVIPWEVGAS